MREGKRDARAVLYEDDGDFVSKGPPGAFRWTGLYGVEEGGPYGMNFKCPCGCGAVHGAGNGQSVGADGYHWHGYLKAGVFEEC